MPSLSTNSDEKANPKSSEFALKTENLTKQFGALTAVDNVSWSVDAGVTKALIGPNGAGKSTLFNLITGVLQPTSGTIQHYGVDITNNSVDENAQHGLIKTFQNTNIFQEDTVFENIRIAAQVKSPNRFNAWRRSDHFGDIETKAAEIIKQVGLTGMESEIAGDLSHGDQRRIEIGIVLATDPDMVLFDEPVAGMSQEGIEQMLELIHRLKDREGLTVLITEHDIDVVLSLADEITVLHQGEILVDGDPESIVNSEEVQRIYIGENDAANT